MNGLDEMRRRLIRDLDPEGEPDIDLFALRLDEEWGVRRKESFELFAERPDLLMLEYESDLAQFGALLDALVRLELWEFCAVLRDRLHLWSSSC